MIGRRRLLLASAAALALGAVRAAEPTGREILQRMESLLWADTMRGDFEMQITTPRWQRTLSLKVWMDRPRRSFVRVVAPAKEAGIGSLRIASEMWNYLPSVERTIKIPPSMMLQPWMGSDFTNDDLVKQSSAIDDYTHKVLGRVMLDGVAAWQIESVPKPEAAVVWDRILYWVREADHVPLKEEFYNERGELVRVMAFSQVRRVGGREVPTRWEMRPLAKPGNRTVIVIRDAAYDVPLDDEIFSQRNLLKP
jgi:outer membrane lipoprotein-sorting protein